MENLGALAAGLTFAIAAFGSATAQGKVASSAMEAIARQPESAGDIRTTLLLSLAFIEALTLFGLVVSILLWTLL
ncbi:ATP synthase F0 subunit C [Clostridia bacterium]|nr:ATP synthase F0 subunit C [Clostridia bacterium]